jgi:Rrf2 family cysteine metabolism transcriptional repressor
MKLSTKSRYSTRAMLDLALHDGEGPQVLRDVAKRQDISVRYLENIMVLLMSCGLVKSTRGKLGGFQLARRPEEIRLSDIVSATEGSLAPVDCVDDPESCGRASECVACNIWTKLRDSIEAFLGSVSLADMREMHRERIDELNSLMYYI